MYQIQSLSQYDFFPRALKRIFNWYVLSGILITRCAHLFSICSHFHMVFVSSSNLFLVKSLSLKIFVLNELSCNLLLEDKQWVKFGGIWWVQLDTLICPWIFPKSKANPQVLNDLMLFLSFYRFNWSKQQKMSFIGINRSKNGIIRTFAHTRNHPESQHVPTSHYEPPHITKSSQNTKS